MPMSASTRKVVIITGSNKDFCYSLCEKYGGNVYLTARSSREGQQVDVKLNESGYNPVFHQLDITDQTSVDSLRDYIKTKYGGLDILINNAEIFANKSLPMGEQAERDVGVNYFGTLRVCEAFFPLLRANGKVINVSSSSCLLQRIPSADLQAKFKDSTLTIENLSKLMQQYVKDAKDNTYQSQGWGDSAYVVSKVGVSALTNLQQKQFDQEKPSRNISANSCNPGFVDIDMSDHKGTLTIEPGAKAPLFLALEVNLKGKYVWFDCRAYDWDGPLPQ